MGRISLISVKKLDSFLKKSAETFQNRKIVCLTGNMASGKNYVSKIFEKNGWLCIDLDKVVHEAIDFLSKEIFLAFKEEATSENINLLDGNSKINRKNLGKLLFLKKELLEKQEKLVYPKVIEITKKIIQENESKNIVLNGTHLFKTKELLNQCSEIYFVKANFFKRLFRAKKRDFLPIGQILRRFASQKDFYKIYKTSGIKFSVIKN